MCTSLHNIVLWICLNLHKNDYALNLLLPLLPPSLTLCFEHLCCWVSSSLLLMAAWAPISPFQSLQVAPTPWRAHSAAVGLPVLRSSRSCWRGPLDEHPAVGTWGYRVLTNSISLFLHCFAERLEHFRRTHASSGQLFPFLRILFCACYLFLANLTV